MEAQLRSLVGSFVERLKERLGDNLVAVVLYGSVARGDFRPESDIDLLVVCESLPPGQLARRRLIASIEEELDEELWPLWERGQYHCFSTLVKERGEALRVSPLYLDMVEDAVLLYDKGSFFAGVLARLRERLGELGARRLRLGRYQYWDLKPDAKPGETVVL